MGSYSFKSVGRTTTQKTSETPTTSPVPLSIKTPMELGPPGEIFKMHTDLSAMVHDNMRNLILTNWGERLGRYNLGANLRPLLSEWTSQDDFDAAAMGRIQSAVQRYMPYVNLEGFETNVTASGGMARSVAIKVTYNVPAIDALNRQLEVVMQIM